VFETLGAQWEIGAIWLLRAEIALSAVYSSDRHPEEALQQALKVAQALGGTVQYKTELRGLPKLMAYLQDDDTRLEFRAFLEVQSEYTKILVYSDRLVINNEAAYVRSSTAALLRHLLRQIRSTWQSIALEVYPDLLEPQAARHAFKLDRYDLHRLGVKLEFDTVSETYSVTWANLSMELA
jgi:hypothetical protein